MGLSILLMIQNPVTCDNSSPSILYTRHWGDASTDAILSNSHCSHFRGRKLRLQMVKGLAAHLGSTPTCFPASVLSEDFQVPPPSGTPGTGPEAWAALSTGEVIYRGVTPHRALSPHPPRQKSPIGGWRLWEELSLVRLGTS